ncbi:MAG: ATP-binding protein [Myxococcales bacterium]|jgi:two-component system OmpR family sensor kinase
MTDKIVLMRAALDVLSGPLILWDADGTIAYASRRFCDAFGLSPEKIEGQPEQGLEAAFARRGVTLSPGSNRFETSEGAVIERKSRALVDGARLETFHDLSAATEQAQRHEEILGVASHDLRSPLANVRSYAGLLLGGRIQLEPRVKRAAEVIARNSDRALRLLQSWFDTQRAETGEFDVDKQPVLLAELLNDAIESRRSFAAEKGVEITTRLPPLLPLVEVDRERFGNALGALLDNALSRSEPSGSVEISYEERPDELRIEFTDNGPMLSPEEREAAFDRDELVLREKHLGLGFAVAVTRAVMQAHGGTAGVESSDGRTTFFLAMPRPKGPAEVVAPPPA